ncbi:MAG: hypothetical protein ABIL46_03125 [candidate division WOR-3 bacterium]
MITNLIILIISSLTISSSNGAFIGEVVYTGGNELSTVSFKLFNQKGVMLYHIIRPEAITFFISDSGVVFATNEQMLYLYELSGNIIPLKRLNYPNGFGFTPDNTLFLASDRDGIYAYSMSGSLIYQFYPGRLFASTDRAKIVAIVSSDTLFYYREGNLKFLKLLQTPFVRKIDLSEDGTIIHLELPDTTEKILINVNKTLED